MMMNHVQSNATQKPAQPTEPKKKMKGPSINIDEL